MLTLLTMLLTALIGTAQESAATNYMGLTATGASVTGAPIGAEGALRQETQMYKVNLS